MQGAFLWLCWNHEVYQKNKRYKQAIELAQQDKMYKDPVRMKLPFFTSTLVVCSSSPTADFQNSVRTAWTAPWLVEIKTWLEHSVSEKGSTESTPWFDMLLSLRLKAC